MYMSVCIACLRRDYGANPALTVPVLCAGQSNKSLEVTKALVRVLQEGNGNPGK